MTSYLRIGLSSDSKVLMSLPRRCRSSARIVTEPCCATSIGKKAVKGSMRVGHRPRSALRERREDGKSQTIANVPRLEEDPGEAVRETCHCQNCGDGRHHADEDGNE